MGISFSRRLRTDYLTFQRRFFLELIPKSYPKRVLSLRDPIRPRRAALSASSAPVGWGPPLRATRFYAGFWDEFQLLHCLFLA